MARFELTTPCTPCKCATGLRYIPIFWRWLPNKIPVNDRMGTGHLLRDGKNTPYFSILFPSVCILLSLGLFLAPFISKVYDLNIIITLHSVNVIANLQGFTPQIAIATRFEFLFLRGLYGRCPLTIAEHLLLVKSLEQPSV